MPWLTPNTPAPTDSFCRRISIPNDQAFIQAVSGALVPLTYESNWEQVGTMTPREASETMRTALIDFFAAVGCPTVPAPYWDEATTNDDEAPADDQPWYGVVEDFLAPIESLTFAQNAAVWVITGFVAYAAGPGAAIFFRTVARRFVLAVERQDVGEIIRVIVDSAEYNVDTSAYGVGEIIEIPVVAPNSNPTHDVYVIGTGNATTRIVRKRLTEDEMNAITDIQQIGGQLQVERANSGVWEDVLNADNVRRDGSTVIVGKQKFRAGNADGLIALNPDVGERAFDVRLPVTTLQDVIRVVDSAGTTRFKVDNEGRFSVRATDSNVFTLYNAAGDAKLYLGTADGNPIIRMTQFGTHTADMWQAYTYQNLMLGRLTYTGMLINRVEHRLVGGSSLYDRDMARLRSVWETPVDASRRAALVLSVYDYAGEREFLRGGSTGSAAKIGFLGASPVERPTITGERAQNAALASLLSAGAALGLWVDNTTAGTAPWIPGELAVTGERDGNPALASLLEALATQGIVWDQTTPGAAPQAQIGSLCATAFGVAIGWYDLVTEILTQLREYVELNPLAPLSYFVVGAAWWTTGYHEQNSYWMTVPMAGTIEDPIGLIEWINTHITGSDSTERLATIDALLAALDSEALTELERLAYCNVGNICPTNANVWSFVTAILDWHIDEPAYAAFAALWSLGALNLDRVQWWATLGNICNADADCSSFQCEGSIEFLFVWNETDDPLEWTSEFNTVSGQLYKISVTGTCWAGEGALRQDADAAYYSNNQWGTYHASTSSMVFRINNANFNPAGSVPYNADHKYSKFITGDGNPITLQWANYPAYPGSTGGNFTVVINGTI